MPAPGGDDSVSGYLSVSLSLRPASLCGGLLVGYLAGGAGGELTKAAPLAASQQPHLNTSVLRRLMLLDNMKQRSAGILSCYT